MDSERRRRSEVSFPARDAGYATADGALDSVNSVGLRRRTEDTMSVHELQRQIAALEISTSQLRRELAPEFCEADADVRDAVDGGGTGDRARHSTVSRPV